MPVDVQETENEPIVEASLPGIKAKDRDVWTPGNQIGIQGEVQQEEAKLPAITCVSGVLGAYSVPC